MTDVEKLLPTLSIVLSSIGAVFLALLIWGVKIAITAIYEAIVVVKILTIEMKELKETVKNLPKIENDLDRAHEKIRELKQEIKGDL